MKIGIGFIAHNRIELTKQSLSALLKQPFDVGIIIDNASTDGTHAYLHRVACHHPQLYVVANQNNLYPGAARNQIVKYLRDQVDLIVFHDNDIIVPEGCFETLPNIFAALPSLGQVSPLAAPKDFLLETYRVAGYELAKTISCCTSAINVVRSTLFRQGLRWRELRWHPEDNGEICEDYYWV
ncbi:MAG: hypothetical protein ETSY1_43570 [Candidatus Entotheonella factor]|uniref:Glycosyltransferase 2-like domain-containing protein n=1 Tax=Entotheonella factor TaxID=1429438 RepID=W4L344_ENTF1|nr:MAG: hypothetical protein ETSY1_43570 [Candidatus Entotheonella factor]